MAKEAQKIRIYVVQKRYGKHSTIVTGVDATKIDIRDLMKKLKSKLACGGTSKNNQIELQGDNRKRIKEILIKEGFPAEIIEVQ